MSDALASIALSFGAGAGLGQGADETAMIAAGMPVRRRCPPVFPFMLPPGILTTTAVGSFIDLPDQWGPPMGWFWDITMISCAGFTAGSIAVARNFPFVTAAGNPVAVEPVASFSQAGVTAFPQKGNPLLDANDRLVFTVTAALTAPNGVVISGSAIAVPAARMDEYLS